MKDHFIAVLSHELRNPLAPIRNGVWLLRQAHDQGGTSQKIIEMLDRQSAHLARLVDDLLDVSRVRTGRISLRLDLVDLCAVARHAIEAALPAIESRKQ